MWGDYRNIIFSLPTKIGRAQRLSWQYLFTSLTLLMGVICHLSLYLHSPPEIVQVTPRKIWRRGKYYTWWRHQMETIFSHRRYRGGANIVSDFILRLRHQACTPCDVIVLWKSFINNIGTFQTKNDLILQWLRGSNMLTAFCYCVKYTLAEIIMEEHLL